MEKQQDRDLSLLFNSLVILPQDRTINESETEPKKAPLLAAETIVKKTTLAKEPAERYEIKKPFAIITTPELKEVCLEKGSAFLKIIEALNVQHLEKYLTCETSIIEKAQNYECLWCIGLDIKSEKDILKLNHGNLLTSTDFLRLKTKEEKKAMYTPLKAFINSNMELISKL